jgi:hypothetical protein
VPHIPAHRRPRFRHTARARLSPGHHTAQHRKQPPQRHHAKRAAQAIATAAAAAQLIQYAIELAHTLLHH